MAHSSTPRFLVLHALRLKGFADADALADPSGLDRSVIEAELAALADEGLVLHREGRMSGWSLTPAGRERHTEAVVAELADCEGRAVVEEAYKRFLDINQDMLAVCTAWQVKEVDGGQAVNDHTDAAYDAEVVQRLVAIHDRVRPVTTDLRGCMERFGRYGDRLRSALEKVVAGETEWFTKPVIDSYHTVWFELHEDLLCTLGIERASEAAS